MVTYRPLYAAALAAGLAFSPAPALSQQAIQTQGQAANLEAKVSNLQKDTLPKPQEIKNPETHWWNYDLTIQGAKGASVALTSAQRCFQDGGCDNPVPVSRMIPPNGEIIVHPSFYTNVIPNTYTLTYTGMTSDNKPVQVKVSIPLN